MKITEYNPVITVVTVCFNSELTIEGTIDSIVNQKYHNLEYIIIDGKSTDSTIDIVKKYSTKNNMRFISEPDKGIYDAMNKAIDLATGEYIIFINSGDRFVDEYVLDKLADKIRDEKSDIYYGNIIHTLNNKPIGRVKYDKVKFNKYSLLKGDMVCHQALIVSTIIMKKKKFNISYSICADKNFIIECFKDGAKFKYIDLDICFYDKSGISTKQVTKLFNEANIIMFTNFPIEARLKYYFSKIKKCIQKIK